jgi:hypothetical protein
MDQIIRLDLAPIRREQKEAGRLNWRWRLLRAADRELCTNVAQREGAHRSRCDIGSFGTPSSLSVSDNGCYCQILVFGSSNTANVLYSAVCVVVAVVVVVRRRKEK